MRPLLSILFISVLLVMAVPAMTYALEPGYPSGCTLRHDLTNIDPACAPNSTQGFATGVTICCAYDVIYTATDLLFIALMIIGLLFMLLGAFNLLTAAGNAVKVTNGRNFIIYAAVGIFAALAAKAVPGIIKFLTGVR